MELSADWVGLTLSYSLDVARSLRAGDIQEKEGSQGGAPGQEISRRRSAVKGQSLSRLTSLASVPVCLQLGLHWELSYIFLVNVNGIYLFILLSFCYNIYLNHIWVSNKNKSSQIQIHNYSHFPDWWEDWEDCQVLYLEISHERVSTRVSVFLYGIKINCSSSILLPSDGLQTLIEFLTDGDF